MAVDVAAGTAVWRALGDRLSDPATMEMILGRILAEVPSYGPAMGGSATSKWVTQQSDQPIVTGVREGRPPLPYEDVSEWYRWGQRRAHQGLAASEMLQCWRIYHDEVRRIARAIVAEHGGDDRLTLVVLDTVAAWIDLAMVTTAEGHRDAEIEIERAAGGHEAELVRGALFGGLAPDAKLRGAEVYGIDLGRRYRALRAELGEGAGPAELARYLCTDGRSGPRKGLVAVVDGNLCGFVAETPPEPPPVTVGVSDPVAFGELPAAFADASRALHTALRFRMPGLHDLSSLGLRTVIAGEAAVGRTLAARYIEPVRALGAVGDGIIDTVRAYVANNGHTEAVARELFVHANTVRYRLGRFEETTGCSLRSYATLVEVWWALEHDSCAGRPHAG